MSNFKLWMSKKKQINKSEMKVFIERLKTHPELYEQFSRILDLSDPEVGDLNLLESFLKPDMHSTEQPQVNKREN
jgi:hypothetical protein